MNVPTWLKPGLIGAFAGAAALAIVGFNWGGWMSAGAADQMAAKMARADVVTALVPYCVAQSKSDPASVETLTAINAATSYKRAEMLMNTGWATGPGEEKPSRDLANACLLAITPQT